MKVWITKYALTQGIFDVTGRVSDYTPDMLGVVNEDCRTEYYHGEGREWHRTEAAAIQRAEQMRVAKLASLRKSIARLEKLTFSVAGGTDDG